MLKNAYLDAKIGVDTAENEPPKECCVVADLSVLTGLSSSSPPRDRGLGFLPRSGQRAGGRRRIVQRCPTVVNTVT